MKLGREHQNLPVRDSRFACGFDYEYRKLHLQSNRSINFPTVPGGNFPNDNRITNSQASLERLNYTPAATPTIENKSTAITPTTTTTATKTLPASNFLGKTGCISYGISYATADRRRNKTDNNNNSNCHRCCISSVCRRNSYEEGGRTVSDNQVLQQRQQQKWLQQNPPAAGIGTGSGEGDCCSFYCFRCSPSDGTVTELVKRESKGKQKQKKKKPSNSGREKSTSTSSFIVAATDQVFLKLVRRIASLRGKSPTRDKAPSSRQQKLTNKKLPNVKLKSRGSESSTGSRSNSAKLPVAPTTTKRARCSDTPPASLECGYTSAVCENPNGANYRGVVEFPPETAETVGHCDELKLIGSSSIGGNNENWVTSGENDRGKNCGANDGRNENDVVSSPDPIGISVSFSEADYESLVAECCRLSDRQKRAEVEELVPEVVSGGELATVLAPSNMGANVSSRHHHNHDKGLTGRRAQSTDNLKSDQTQSYQQYQYHPYLNNNVISNNNNNNNTNNNQQTTTLKSIPPDLAPQGDFCDGFLSEAGSSTGTGNGSGNDRQATNNGSRAIPGAVAPGILNPCDRNKFCGSLPNHLDADDACEAIFKQNEFLQAHLKNVLASHQQPQPEYGTVTGSGVGPLALDQTALSLMSTCPANVSSQAMANHIPRDQQNSSPFCSSSSGKGSTVSSIATSGTIRCGSFGGSSGTTGDHPDVAQMKLPLHRLASSEKAAIGTSSSSTNNNPNPVSSSSSTTTTTSTTLDTGLDQGYGSERSPEDEMPPPLLLMHEAQYNEILASSQQTQQPPVSVVEPNDLQRFWNYEKAAASLIASGEYGFITKDTVFLVQVPKGTRGLGLSVSGGSDSSASFPGLIRIKRLFPHQAAWATGMLQAGDILLEANGIPLTGLTNCEALEVLRTAPNYVTLTVCRPRDEQYRKLSPPSEPPKPPTRTGAAPSLATSGGEPEAAVGTAGQQVVLPPSPQLSIGSSTSSTTAGCAGQQQQMLQHQYQLQQQQQQQQMQQMQQFSQQQIMMMPYYYQQHQQQQQQQQQHYIYPPQSLTFAPLDPLQTNFSGEFEIILTKQQGSLGFTLRKEDESILGHYVRALVRDPALNDGRIKPGDRIMAVNDIPISQMTHEQAVIFLRQSADVVKLRLYRDQAQTPISAHSPTIGGDRCCNSELADDQMSTTSTVCGHGSGKPKPNLRPEALNLLTDLAYRKQNSTCNSGSTSSSAQSSNSSPRRLRRGFPPSKKTSFDNHGFQHSGGETSQYSGSETSTIVSHQQQQQMVPGGPLAPGMLYHSSSCRSCGGGLRTVAMMLPEEESLDDSYYCDEEIEAASLYDEDGDEATTNGQRRPNYLNLAGESGSTPMSSRKPRFQYSVATTNAYELNNLDNAALDAPTLYGLPHSTGSSGAGPPGSSSSNDQFISLPCETFLVACKTEQDLHDDSTDAIYVKHFAHKSPLYSSVHVPLKDGTMADMVDAVEKGGKKSLMKWKGATLMSEEDDETVSTSASNETPSQDGATTTTTTTDSSFTGTLDSGSAADGDGDGTLQATPTDTLESSLAATLGTASTTTPTTERDLLSAGGFGVDGDGNKIFTVELNKGWNSRLGFSLRQNSSSGRTAVSAIYSESVAAKDGRLRIGDQLLMVNDESVESMTAAQVINLLRIIRGSISLRLLRVSNNNQASDSENIPNNLQLPRTEAGSQQLEVVPPPEGGTLEDVPPVESATASPSRSERQA
ncbi:uncharacterized protein LOC129740087 [Uranotaenia lowii]|uniref:uncharacterized protein LOC129740087 n=1 Tax=Uranotaenia lowii TaxID=190385 RepID=UPI002478D1F0|nr:uncharacterized protein LOC129740087 [Uranotaenia lowii]